MRLRSDKEVAASPTEEVSPKEQPADEVVTTEDDGDEDWEDERTYDIKTILETAEQVNRLLLALVNHPEFVGSDPTASPKPLWYTADFVKRTYVEYALPILPQFCFYRSPRFVNRKILNYANKSIIINGERLEIAEGPPTREQDEWLEDAENCPDEDEHYIERANDLISRNMMSAMMIADKEKGGMMLGGQFEFGEEVENAVTEILGGKEEREHFEKTKAGFKK